ncbi:MAG: ATP-binding protein [candidate division Zixibacteria bacterium]|nr:ATP-binding protein [candidate division Zixibacteria bacterium]
MDKPQIVKDGIIIPSSTDFLADVDKYLEEKFSDAGVDPSIMTDVAISVSELVNNAIIHGNKSDMTKRVDIRFSVTDTVLKVIIIDEGEGFDADTVENPIDDDNLLKEVGRGIFIVKSFVDDVQITAGSEGGTRVEITKNF